MVVASDVEWKERTLSNDSREWIEQNGIIYLSEDVQQTSEPALSFYQAVGGVEQGRLASKPSHASHYDRPRYSALVKATIDLVCKDDITALDLGCGDGRGVRMLLESGVKKIVAIDFHFPTLQRLMNSLSTNEQSCVLPICASITMRPIRNIQIDVALCIELLTTLPSPTIGLEALHLWLKKEHTRSLIIEPAVEGSMMYALLDGDFKALTKILTKRKRFDTIAGETLEIHLQTKESLNNVLTASGFELLRHEPIPGGAALTIAALKSRSAAFTNEDLETIAFADTVRHFSPRMHAAIVRPRGGKAI